MRIYLDARCAQENEPKAMRQSKSHFKSSRKKTLDIPIKNGIALRRLTQACGF